MVLMAAGLVVVGRLILWAAEGGKRRETEPATGAGDLSSSNESLGSLRYLGEKLYLIS